MLLTYGCISAFYRLLRLTAKDILPSMSDKAVESLRSKIQFSSVFETFTPPPPPADLIPQLTAQTTALTEH